MPSVSGPAQIEIGTTTPITITRDMQFEDAMLSIERMNFELKTQQSDAPDDYRKTGISVGLSLSISDATNLNLIALALNTTVVSPGSNPYIALSDDAGKGYTRIKVVVKPFASEVVSTDASTWWTLPSAAAVTDEAFENAFGLTTQRAFSLRLMGLAVPTGTYKGIKAVYGTAPVGL